MTDQKTPEPAKTTDRWRTLDFGPPSGGEDTEPAILLDHVDEGRVAVVTLNRPHADNAISTEMGALLTDVLETVAVTSAIRVVVITGAGDRAFSVGSDLRERKNMTKSSGCGSARISTAHCTPCVSCVSRSSPPSTGSRTAAAPRSPRAPTSSSPATTPSSVNPRRCWVSPLAVGGPG